MSAPDSLTLTRRFKAPRERVFAAFTTIEAIGLWLGPESCGVTGGRMDFQVGGTYLYQMKTPHGDMELRGTYREISPPSRLVFTWQWVEDDAPLTTVTVDLTEVGEDTELTLTQTGFTSAESAGNHAHGWSGSFDRLDNFLAA